jgi:putative endonuclease
MFIVYILQNQDGLFYKGYTTNLELRIEQHNDPKLDKYTSKRGPWSLVFQKTFLTKKDALIEEKRIKRLNKAALIRLIQSTSNELVA